MRASPEMMRMKDFAELDLKDQVRPLVMKTNALAALGLTPKETA